MSIRTRTIAAVRWLDRHAKPPEAQSDAVSQAKLIDRESRATRGFEDALGAFAGPQHRLHRLAEAAGEMADTLRAAERAGLPPAGSPSVQRYGRPVELASPVESALAAWEALDSAFETLIAAETHAESLLERAAAYEAVSQAAAALAGALAENRYDSGLPRG